MPDLTITDIPDELLENLRARARANRRSLSKEVIILLEESLEESPGLEPFDPEEVR